MTTDRQLPQFFGRVNERGTPYIAVITAWLFGPLAYLSLGSGGASQAFSWLLNLSTVAGLIAWAVLAFSYIRFHHRRTNPQPRGHRHLRPVLLWRAVHYPCRCTAQCHRIEAIIDHPPRLV